MLPFSNFGAKNSKGGFVIFVCGVVCSLPQKYTFGEGFYGFYHIGEALRFIFALSI